MDASKASGFWPTMERTCGLLGVGLKYSELSYEACVASQHAAASLLLDPHINDGVKAHVEAYKSFLLQLRCEKFFALDGSLENARRRGAECQGFNLLHSLELAFKLLLSGHFGIRDSYAPVDRRQLERAALLLAMRSPCTEKGIDDDNFRFQHAGMRDIITALRSGLTNDSLEISSDHSDDMMCIANLLTPLIDKENTLWSRHRSNRFKSSARHLWCSDADTKNHWAGWLSWINPDLRKTEFCNEKWVRDTLLQAATSAAPRSGPMWLLTADEKLHCGLTYKILWASQDALFLQSLNGSSKGAESSLGTNATVGGYVLLAGIEVRWNKERTGAGMLTPNIAWALKVFMKDPINFIDSMHGTMANIEEVLESLLKHTESEIDGSNVRSWIQACSFDHDVEEQGNDGYAVDNVNFFLQRTLDAKWCLHALSGVPVTILSPNSHIWRVINDKLRARNDRTGCCNLVLPNPSVMHHIHSSPKGITLSSGFAPSFKVPEPPEDVVANLNDTRRLEGKVKKMILNRGAKNTIAVRGKPSKSAKRSARFGVQGMGGIGKTTALRIIANDKEVQDEFTAGIYWMQMGEGKGEADMVSELSNIVSKSGGPDALAQKVKRAKLRDVVDQARDWFAKAGEHPFLIVVDDVWEIARNSGGGLFSLKSILTDRSCIVFSTRPTGVVQEARASSVEFHALEAKEGRAENILMKSANMEGERISEEDRPWVDKILDKCSGLPLLLAIVGRTVGYGSQTWRECADDLEQPWLNYGDAVPSEDHPGLPSIVETSLRQVALKKGLIEGIGAQYSLEEMFRGLCVFPKQGLIPVGAVARLWGFYPDVALAKKMIKELKKVGLVTVTGNTVSLHDIVLDYCDWKCKRMCQLQEWHRRLLQSYERKGRRNDRSDPRMDCVTVTEEWWNESVIEDDGYICGNLCRHLAGCGKARELNALVTDFRWIVRRTRAMGVGGLLEDISVAEGFLKSRGNTTLWCESLRNSIKMSRAALLQGERELSFQILGRILPYQRLYPELDRLLASTCRYGSSPWLEPLKGCLESPESNLKQTFEAGEPVRSIALSQDERYIYSACGRNVLRFDRRSGKNDFTFSGSPYAIDQIVLSRDRKHLISMSSEDKYEVVEDEQDLCELSGSSEGLVAMSAEGSCVVTISQFEGFVWNARTGKQLCTLRGMKNKIDVYAGTPIAVREHCVVMGSTLGSLHMWNAETGEHKGELSGHTDMIEGVSISSDCTRVVASSHCTIRVWNVNAEAEICKIEEPEHITAVAISADGAKIAFGTFDDAVRTCDVDSGCIAAKFAEHTMFLDAIALSKDGNIVASGDGYEVFVWDGCTGQELYSDLFTCRDDLKSLSLRMEGANCTVVSLYDNGDVCSWNSRTHREVLHFAGRSPKAYVMAVNEAGTRFVLGSSMRRIHAQDVDTGEKDRELSVDQRIGHNVSCFLEPGSGCLVCIDEKRMSNLQFWDAFKGARVHTIPFEASHGAAEFIVVNEECGLAAIRRSGYKVEVWDTRIRQTILHKENVLQKDIIWVSGTPGGTLMLIRRVTRELILLDVRSRKETCIVGVDGFGFPRIAVLGTAKSTIIMEFGGLIHMFDLETGRHMRTFDADSSQVNAITIGRNGLLLSADMYGIIKEWDTTGIEDSDATSSFTPTITSVSGRADGSTIVVGALDGSLEVWEVSKQRKVSDCKRILERMRVLAISSDGLIMAIIDENALGAAVWNLKESKKIRELNGHSKRMTDFALNNNGSRAVSGSLDLTIKTWNVETGEELHVIACQHYPPGRLSFCKDGSQVTWVAGDRVIRTHDVETGMEICTSLLFIGETPNMAVNRKGSHILVWGSYQAFVHKVDGLQTVWNFLCEDSFSRIEAAALDADGTRVALIINQSLAVWDLRTGIFQCKMETQDDWVSCISIAFSMTGSSVVLGFADCTIRIRDIATGKMVREFIGHSSYLDFIWLSLDGSRAISGSADCSVRVWDIEKEVEIQQLGGNPKAIAGTSISANGSKLASFETWDKKIQTWNAESGEQLCDLVGHTNWISCVQLSEGGLRAISGSEDRTVRLWNTVTGEEILKFMGHEECVSVTALSSDVRFVVSGSEDKTIRIWDAETGEPLRKIDAHSHEISELYISAGVTEAVSADSRGNVKLWNIQTHFDGPVITSMKEFKSDKRPLDRSGLLNQLIDVRSNNGATDGPGSAIFSLKEGNARMLIVEWQSADDKEKLSTVATFDQLIVDWCYSRQTQTVWVGLQNGLLAPLKVHWPSEYR